MGAFFSLEFVQSVVAAVVLCIGLLKGLLLPDQHGASAFLPEVMDQLKRLERQKVIDGEVFPGSNSSPSLSERCKWMTKVHESCRPIGQIIWPGTHYSATNKIGIPYITRPFGQRQTMSIIDQLINGVRALDIRIQQDHRVCNGNMVCNTTLADIVKDIKYFLGKQKFEIIILEIRTERGFRDPENFEDYLVGNFGDLLIHQDDQVFFKSISDVLPGRIICIWKPIIKAYRPRQGGPVWSGKYLKCDEFDTQMPLTRFEGNMNNLKSRSVALKTYNYFYKVENTLSPRTNSILETLLVWPKCANVVCKRISGFARLYLANCHNDGTLHRIQIYSIDFVSDDFISSCIGLSQDSTTLQGSNISEMMPHNDVDSINNNCEDNMINNNIYGNNNANVNNSITWLINEFLLWIKPRMLKIVSSEDDKQWKWVNSLGDGDESSEEEVIEGENEFDQNKEEDKNNKYEEGRDDENEEDDENFEAPQCIEIYSLDVSGEYQMEEGDNFRQGIKYNVLFCVKMEEWAFGWESPVNLRLILPDGSTQENHQLLHLSSDEELFLPIGNFIMSSKMMGEIKFSLEQHENTLKGGLTLHGVCIQELYNEIVIPRNLSINLADDGQCWSWFDGQNSYIRGKTEMAALISVRHFQVSAVFDTEKLSFGCTYRVAFTIELTSEATGWENPTKLSLLLPNGSLQQVTEIFKDLPTNRALSIYVGEFTMMPEMLGKMQASMINNDESEKTGLDIAMAFIEQQH